MYGLSEHVNTPKQELMTRSMQLQEPMSRSMQLHYIPVTAFSQTDLFLDRISSE